MNSGTRRRQIETTVESLSVGVFGVAAVDGLATEDVDMAQDDASPREREAPTPRGVVSYFHKAKVE